MRKYRFYLLLVGLILVFLNPVHSQPGKKISLGVNVSAFSEKSPGLNLGFSAMGLFNVNKFISLYASSGFLHRKEAGIRSTVSVLVNNNPVQKATTGKVKLLNYIPALLGVRLYAKSKKTQPCKLGLGLEASIASRNSVFFGKSI